ncbi:MAG: chemotaxis protein CheW [Alteromonadaceae bacterium]|nr:chemotaxis protein CheW [Alteromonadaceae bacterium]
MAGVLDSVNQRTQMVGENRLELLLFRLQGRQTYGINVFKVREVLPCPKLSGIPKRNPVVRGVAYVRGETISIVDAGMAIGLRPISDEEIATSFVIITEYNRRIQGFLVKGVDRIVNLNWDEIHPPPREAGQNIYFTGVTRIEDNMVGIIDVEKILAEVQPMVERPSTAGTVAPRDGRPLRVLVVDDSSVARRQIQRCMESLGLEVVIQKDGKQALAYLQGLVSDGSDITQHFSLMISDVEMPEMDGYTLVTRCKADPALAKLYIMLHTSLSGVFNNAMVKKVGADDFMAKFIPDELAERVIKIMDEV